MHKNFDLTVKELTKVEGGGSLDLRVRKGKVEHVYFEITESKRFFTRAIEGKPIASIPQLLSRICGTCSSAHLLCSIEACERALGIIPTEQTMLLRHLTTYGLNIRDHALHLYIFALPDFYNKDSFLDFDENDKEQNQILHDAFEIKAAGNYLATIISGRAVHAGFPVIGGFTHFPSKQEIEEAVKKLNTIRPAVLRLIKIFEKSPFSLKRKMDYMALETKGHFGYLDGEIVDSRGNRVAEAQYRDHLEHVVLPYSQASAYKHDGHTYMIGALARLNINKKLLHKKTKQSLGPILDRFPSTDVFDNNLAQAIEILHCLDHAIEILTTKKISPEPIIKKKPHESVGIGVIEAPRGLLYHKIAIDNKGIIQKGEIVVPTGQNQIAIEEDYCHVC